MSIDEQRITDRIASYERIASSWPKGSKGRAKWDAEASAERAQLDGIIALRERCLEAETALGQAEREIARLRDRNAAA